MDGLYRRKCWVKVLRSSLTPQDKNFSTRFQHMRRKDDTGLGDFEDAFSPVPHASGFRTILALATQHHMLCDHVDISQAFVQGDLLPGDGHNGKVYISLHRLGMRKTMVMSTSSDVPYTACQVPVPGIRP